MAQSTSALLLVAPSAFASNAETRLDNAFMEDNGGVADQQQAVRRAALAEHGALCDMLRRLGCNLTLIEQSASDTPDACFPNNLFSTHAFSLPSSPASAAAATTLVQYAMRAPSRRREWPALEQKLKQVGYPTALAVGDCSHSAEDQSDHEALEGTGSLVLDRVHGIAYMAESPRSSLALLTAAVGAGSLPGIHRIVAFRATDAPGRAIYHTNVIMAVGSAWAVVCTECIPDATERERVAAELRAVDGRTVVEISVAQMGEFCGNILEVRDGSGRAAIVMSARARSAFTAAQLEVLGAACAGGVHAVAFETIERVGGGGVRCCIAELFGL